MTKQEAKELIKQLIREARKKAVIKEMGDWGPPNDKTRFDAPQSSNPTNNVKMPGSQLIQEVVFNATMDASSLNLIKQYLNTLGKNLKMDNSNYGQLHVYNISAKDLKPIIMNFNPAALSVGYRQSGMTAYSGLKLMGNVDRQQRFAQALAGHVAAQAPSVDSTFKPGQTKIPSGKTFGLDQMLGDPVKGNVGYQFGKK